MTRIEHIGDAALYLNDSRLVMGQWPNQVWDAVVTDPPYGIDKAAWDSEYPKWLESEALRIARVVCIMPGQWALPACITGLGDQFRAVISGRNLNGMTFGPIGFSNWIPAVCAGEVPHRGMDAFEFTVGAEAKPDHPSPKPLSYMLKLIDRVSEPGWTVCDPFMGSGTVWRCLRQPRPQVHRHRNRAQVFRYRVPANRKGLRTAQAIRGQGT